MNVKRVKEMRLHDGHRTSAKHNEYKNYYSGNEAVRQAVKKSKKSADVHTSLALNGLLLLVASSGADEAGLLSGKAMVFVTGVALLAMWIGGRNHAA